MGINLHRGAAALVACLLLAGSALAADPYKAGTYRGTAQGKNGPVTVEVQCASTSIVSVKVLKQSESAGLSDPALAEIPARIVAKQSLAVDAVSGATTTSEAIIEAAGEALAAAGADLKALRAPSAAAAAAAAAPAQIEVSTEVCVVGAGGAGLMAAMEAASKGAKVLVVEKASSVSASNTAQIGGTAGVQSRVSKAAGERITSEALFAHMIDYAHWTVDAPLLRKCLDVSGEVMDKLQDLGVKTFLGPDRYNVGFREVHVYETPADKKMALVADEVKRLGGTFMFETAGKKLLVEGGKVVGLVAERPDGTSVKISAKAVLLCTGGFLGNPEMMKRYFGDTPIANLGSTLNTGDGISMALAAGGVMERPVGVSLNDISGTNVKSESLKSLAVYFSPARNQALDLAFIGGLLVDTSGHRFFDEYQLANNPLAGGGEATLRAGRYYAVLDRATLEALSKKSPYERLGKPKVWTAGPIMFNQKLDRIFADLKVGISEGWVYEAGSVKELGAKLGMVDLEKTVAEYNAMCAAKKDSLLSKVPAFLTPVVAGPFYLVEFQPGAWCTFGGVKVDDRLRALDKANKVIPGLYVAGLDAGSLYCSPYYDVGGTASGLAMDSGKLAGAAMADYVSGTKK